jgi:hypothetical protein
MANPTTNYGFVLPTPTDLVTDLPADFEVALQGVDTQMKTNADAAIAKTIVDAKGDLIAGTGSDTVSRLAVGTNGQALLADSSTATGLKWDTPAAGGMTLLSTTSLSGATTTISSIDQTYTTLMLEVFGVTNATGDGKLRIAPNGVAGIVTMFGTNSNTSVSMGPNEFIHLNAFDIPMKSTDANNSFFVQINNYKSTTNYKPVLVAGVYYAAYAFTQFCVSMGGGIQTNSAITSLVFSNTGGNLSTGTVRLYGVK